MSTRHLLIDGDIIAYQAASSAEVAIEWHPGYWTWHCGEFEVKAKVDDLIDEMCRQLGAQEFTLAVSDKANFRYDILPTYKGNRTQKRPLVLRAIKDWLIADKGAMVRPGLEGDDVLGILQTWPKYLPGKEKVIVALDKDMKTIPGLYVRSLKDRDKTGNVIVTDITEEAADNWHLIQTLMGDPTDGYTGCPGTGAITATNAIVNRQRLVPYEHSITRGPRKGETEIRFESAPEENPWEIVKSFYAAQGLSEAVALQQARVARILRASDYDFKRKVPILWTPN